MFSKNEKYFTLVEEKPGIWENWLFFFSPVSKLGGKKLMYILSPAKLPKTVKTEIAS